jgi:L-lactate dehydrogenase (cytochrome)
MKTGSHHLGRGMPEFPARSARSLERAARQLRHMLSLDDFERAAQKILPKMVFEHIAGAVERRQSLHENHVSFLTYSFRPRMLVNTSARKQTVRLFGRSYCAPFGIAPMGGSLLAAGDGDRVLARAAAAAGIPFILSASSLTSLEKVAVAGGKPWFQAYLPGEPGRILPMLDRLDAAGFETLVLTVDVPILGNRENNIRAGFSIPVKPSAKLFWQVATRPRWLLQWGLACWREGIPHFENLDAARGPPIFSRTLERSMAGRDSLTWQHVELIRQHWKGKLVLKGILRADDARLACQRGVDGLIVSNHGGRQLDGAIAPLRALEEVVAEAGSMSIMLDGGVRRGSDVLKALAMGADFVFVGRPFLYAAAIAGQAGASHAISLLASEIDRDMALLGICELSEMCRDFLVH